MSWVKWNVVLLDFDQCRLNIRSLIALNFAFLLKWRPRLSTKKDMLWVKVIKAVYGPNGGIDSCRGLIRGSGPWVRIIASCKRLEDKNIISC